MVLPKPVAPPVPDESADAQQQDCQRLHGLAHYLSHNMAGAYVYAAVGATISTGRNDLEGYQLYVQQLMTEAGNPSDPIERMLVEQLALAHHNIGRLSIRAADAQSLEQTKILEAAMARLLSEFRKTAMSLKEFREPKSRKQFTLIKQQNLAQSQQVAYVDRPRAGQEEEMTAEDEEEETCDNEVGSKLTEAIEHVEQISPLTRSDASCGRKTEPLKVEGPDA